MFILRPVAESDLAALGVLTRAIVGGLTSLPPEETFLRERIDESLRAFSPLVRKPGAEQYLFVLEETTTGRIVGTSGIIARVGGYDPFYSYERRIERHVHAPLGIDHGVEILQLKQVHRGPTEIGGLFLDPACRRDGLGRLLSLARFLFIGCFPHRFDAVVIAELRGYLDQRGHSPFWEAVGRHFFQHDFYTADVLSGLGNKAFIADLMPRHPVYVPLLAPGVQAVIGQVHHDTLPALALLRSEGFGDTPEVDIFDGGPQLRAATAEIRTIRQSRMVDVGPGEPPADAVLYVITNDSLEFRACLTRFDPTAAVLPEPVLEALGRPARVTCAPARS